MKVRIVLDPKLPSVLCRMLRHVTTTFDSFAKTRLTSEKI